MGRHKLAKPIVTQVSENLSKIGLSTCISLNDEGRTYFLDRVYVRPILWDRNHPDFRRAEDRKSALKEIREELLASGYITGKVPIVKMNNTLTLLKACYRTKKKLGKFDKHAATCQWLQKIDSFMHDCLTPYKDNERRLAPGPAGTCSLEDHLKLLLFYKEHELLWNPKHPMYHDRPTHVLIWQQASEHMNKEGFTADGCKKIVKTLRTRYINRRKVMSLPDVEEYCKHLEWFGLAESFLGPLLFPLTNQKIPSAAEIKHRDFAAIEEAASTIENFEELGPLPKNMRTLGKEEKYAIYLRFLKVYQKLEVLWNRDHPNYGLEIFRKKAWNFFAERVNIRYIKPKECKEKIKRIRAAYVVRRRSLTEQELELVFLQPEWFVMCETILGRRLFRADGEMISDDDDERNSESEGGNVSEEEVDHLLATMKVEDDGKAQKKPVKRKRSRTAVVERKIAERKSPVDRKELPIKEESQMLLEPFAGTLQLDNLEHLDEIRLRIISAYKHHELLWNTKHNLYTATPRRHQGWNDVTELVNVEGLTVALTKSYVQDMRRIYKIKLKENNEKEPIWYYVIESFLKELLMTSDVNKGRPKRSNDSEVEEVSYSRPKRSKPTATVVSEDMVIKPDFMPVDCAAQPEFIATDVIDLIKKEEEDAIILTEPAPAVINSCRACFQDFRSRGEELKCLNSTTVDGITMRDIYNECIGSGYHDADSYLPEAICDTCFQTIISFSVFRKKCLINERQHLSARQIQLIEKSNRRAFKRQQRSYSNDELNGCKDVRYDDKDDTFSWEDDLPLNVLSADVKPSTSKLMRQSKEESRRKRSKKKRSRREERRRSPIVAKLEIEHTSQPSTQQQQPQDLEKALPENFDVGDFDIESFFDNGGGGHQDAEEAGTNSGETENDSEIEEALDTIVDPPSVIMKHDKVITEDAVAWTPRQVKKKNPEQAAKEEAMFADYLKEMLEVAKRDPVKDEGKTEKKKYQYDNQICPECGLSVRNMGQHMKMHQSPDKLHCENPICKRKKPFKNMLQLQQHMRRVHRQELKLNKCETCNMSFTTRKERAIHMRTVHPENKCDVCGRVYKTQYLMMIHRNTVHVKERNEDGSALQCDLCAKEFRNYTLMNQHRRRVHFKKKFDCNDCDYTCRTLRQLKRHQIAEHTEDAQKYICHLCEKKFVHLHYLKNHFLLRHSKEARYTCHLCPRSFKYNAKLRTHYDDCHPDYELPPKGDSIIQATEEK